MNRTLFIQRLRRRAKAAEYMQRRLALLAERQCRLSQDWYGKYQSIEGSTERLQQELVESDLKVGKLKWELRQEKQRRRRAEWVSFWNRARMIPGGAEKLDRALYEFLAWISDDMDYRVVDEDFGPMVEHLEKLGFKPIDEGDE